MISIIDRRRRVRWTKIFAIKKTKSIVEKDYAVYIHITQSEKIYFENVKYHNLTIQFI